MYQVISFVRMNEVKGEGHYHICSTCSNKVLLDLGQEVGFFKAVVDMLK